MKNTTKQAQPNIFIGLWEPIVPNKKIQGKTSQTQQANKNQIGFRIIQNSYKSLPNLHNHGADPCFLGSNLSRNLDLREHPPYKLIVTATTRQLLTLWRDTPCRTYKSFQTTAAISIEHQN